MQKPPRTWISNATPKQGELMRVRAQIEHTMESGLRTDPATGKVRHRNILSHFEARLDDALLFAWTPGISIAQNPLPFMKISRPSGSSSLMQSGEASRTDSANPASDPASRSIARKFGSVGTMDEPDSDAGLSRPAA